MRTTVLLEKALFAKSGEVFTEVSLPHTWNAFDGQDGGSDYWRGTDDDHMGFPEGFYSVKDTVKEIAAIRNGKLLVELLANIGAFGPIVAIKTMQPPVPLMDFLPMVGNLPAGGMSYINSQLNQVPKK